MILKQVMVLQHFLGVIKESVVPVTVQLVANVHTVEENVKLRMVGQLKKMLTLGFG